MCMFSMTEKKPDSTSHIYLELPFHFFTHLFILFFHFFYL